MSRFELEAARCYAPTAFGRDCNTRGLEFESGTKKEKAEAYRIICDYALNGKEPEQSAITPMVAILFEIVRPVLDTAHKRAQLAKKLSDQKQLQADILPPVEVQV
mgnify:CR=1 FL=1